MEFSILKILWAYNKTIPYRIKRIAIPLWHSTLYLFILNMQEQYLNLEFFSAMKYFCNHFYLTFLVYLAFSFPIWLFIRIYRFRILLRFQMSWYYLYRCSFFNFAPISTLKIGIKPVNIFDYDEVNTSLYSISDFFCPI